MLPFHRFRAADGSGVDTVLGPEMRSTGEVMGLDAAFGTAFAKSQAAAYGSLPTAGGCSSRSPTGTSGPPIFPVKRLADLGFEVLATEGTALVLRRNGVPVEVVGKHGAAPGSRRTACERILRGDVDLVFNTPWGSPGNCGPRLDGYEIRTAAVAVGIPCITTVQGMAACVQGIEALRRGDIGVRSLQELHAAAEGGVVGERGARGYRAGPDAGAGPRARCSAGAGWAPTTCSRWPPAGIAERARPGQFVAVSVGGPASALLLRRAFALYRATADGGVLGDGPVRGRRARPGHRVAGRAAAGRAAGPGRPARARRSGCRRRRPAACWSAAGTARRRCSAWPRRCGPGSAGWTSLLGAGTGGPALRRAGGEADRRRGRR